MLRTGLNLASFQHLQIQYGSFSPNRLTSAPRFWCFLVVPGCIYVIDKIATLRTRWVTTGEAELNSRQEIQYRAILLNCRSSDFNSILLTILLNNVSSYLGQVKVVVYELFHTMDHLQPQPCWESDNDSTLLTLPFDNFFRPSGTWSSTYWTPSSYPRT